MTVIVTSWQINHFAHANGAKKKSTTAQNQLPWIV
jgi:hypothetical protein